MQGLVNGIPLSTAEFESLPAASENFLRVDLSLNHVVAVKNDIREVESREVLDTFLETAFAIDGPAGSAYSGFLKLFATEVSSNFEAAARIRPSGSCPHKR